MKFGLGLVCLILFSFSLVNATDYYVDQDAGNDANAGTTGVPWKNCPGMLAYSGSGSLSSGDTVYFDANDTWTLAQLTLRYGFNDVGGVTYIGDTWKPEAAGTRAKFVANYTVTADGFATVNIDGSNVTFQGFEIDMNDLYTSGINIGYRDPNGGSYGDIDNVLIDNCIVHGSGNIGTGRYYYGIIMNTRKGTITNITVQNTSVYTTGHEGIAIYASNGDSDDSVNNVLVDNCVVYDTGNGGAAWGEGIYIANNVNNVIVQDSEIYDSTSRGVSTDQKGSNPSPDEITIRRNLIHDNAGEGLKFLSRTGYPGSQDIYAYNNFIYGNGNADLVIIGTFVRVIEVYNNTFYTTTANTYFGGVKLDTITATGETFIFKNNIFYATQTYAFQLDSATVLNYLTHSYNSYFRVDAGNWVNIVGSTGYDGTEISSWEATAQNSDPLFTDAANGDFTPLPGSPACGSGSDGGDIGAIECAGEVVVSVYECNDSVDNDLDGEVDLGDSGCDSLTDDDESDCGDGVCEGLEECGDCVLDCGECLVECVHDADLEPCDGVVSTLELSGYIDRWLVGDVSMGNVMGAINAWSH